MANVLAARRSRRCVRPSRTTTRRRWTLTYTVADANHGLRAYRRPAGTFERLRGTDADARASVRDRGGMPGRRSSGCRCSTPRVWLSHGADDRHDAGPDGPFVGRGPALSADRSGYDPFSR